jgi:hypothetical protein
MFALYVVTGGYVPTESGRGQTKRGASKEPLDKERIRRSGGGWLVLAEQMEWIDRERERKTGPDEPS